MTRASCSWTARRARPGAASEFHGPISGHIDHHGKTRFLEFEHDIEAFEKKVDELRELAENTSESAVAVSIDAEVAQLENKSRELLKKVYADLTPWQMSLVARHPNRPYTLDYIDMMFTDFQELHGDRAFADDEAIVGGLARLADMNVIVIGNQKGRTLRERTRRNFGMARPEGYRKALRLMKLAEKFGLPVITFVDTPGAIPASTPRSAASPRPSATTSTRCPPSTCRSSPA